MSSLAAVQADGFYHPPEYRPEHGSINKFRNSHPLGDRAKKIGQGILVIRFEMPFKVWCLGCNAITAKGVRFNAEKKCVGNYFTTKIWEFSMKCYHCDTRYKIRTDPEACEYKLIDGLRMKVETYDAEDAVTIEFMDEEERAKVTSDAMLSLERCEEGAKKARGRLADLEDILEINDSRADDGAANSFLRKRFRIAKKEAILRETEEAKPKNFAMPLVEERQKDVDRAKRVKFRANTVSANSHKLARAAIQTSSIFSDVTSKTVKKQLSKKTGDSTPSTKASSRASATRSGSSNRLVDLTLKRRKLDLQMM
eukprot:Selendium_serpulae@DN3346_c0_g1_i2.p1